MYKWREGDIIRHQFELGGIHYVSIMRVTRVIDNHSGECRIKNTIDSNFIADCMQTKLGRMKLAQVYFDKLGRDVSEEEYAKTKAFAYKLLYSL